MTLCTCIFPGILVSELPKRGIRAEQFQYPAGISYLGSAHSGCSNGSPFSAPSPGICQDSQFPPGTWIVPSKAVSSDGPRRDRLDFGPFALAADVGEQKSPRAAFPTSEEFFLNVGGSERCEKEAGCLFSILVKPSSWNQPSLKRLYQLTC